MADITLCVGPHVGVELRDPPGGQRRQDHAWFSAGPLTHSLLLEVRRGFLPDTAGLTPLVDSGGPWRLFHDGSLHRFELVTGPERRPYEVASIDFAAGRGCLHLPEGSSAPPFEYPLSQIVFTKLLADHGAVIVHAAGVQHDGLGLLLPGNSGAGKSTLAQLFHRRAARVLSDDRVAVGPEQGTPSMSGTPWPGTANLLDPATVPLQQLVFLRHGQRNALHGLNRREATLRLLALCMVPYWHEAAAEAAIDAAVGLAARLPAHELEFVPTGETVDFLLQRLS